MYRTTKLAVSLVALFAAGGAANAQSPQTPSVSQVLMYSATTPGVTIPAGATSGLQPSASMPAGAVPGIFTQTVNIGRLSDYVNSSGVPGSGNDLSRFAGVIYTGSNYSISRSLVDLNNALNASIATALSIIPLSSPASGVITRTDPATGAELPVSSTLGPIFTERAETIGKGRWYIGFSNQDFHFTRFNGQSLNSLRVLYPGGDKSQIINDLGTTSSPLLTVPATFNVGMDVRLSQDIAFITYGVADRLDVSLGLPVVHAAVAARTFNGVIYAGTGFGTLGSTCWCVNTFTPGTPTLTLPNIGQSSFSKTGFGDLLLRVKGTVFRRPGIVAAIGADLRFPTGDELNYLGVGTTSVKPFVAVSLYSKPLSNNIVFSPHFDVGWQFSGKSVLGGALQPTPIAGTPYIGAPFTQGKDFLPDVLSWAVGAEVAFGRHNTVIADILGNQIGLVHGIFNTTLMDIPNQLAPTGPNGTAPASLGGPAAQPAPAQVTAAGLVSAGRVSFGQYSGSFGYKARVAGNLGANFYILVRFDNNGLTARFVPICGLGYSF